MVAGSLLAGGAELGAEFGGVEEAAEGSGKFGDAAWIDVEGAFSGDFREAGGIGSEDGDAAGHSLGNGEAKAFVEGGIGEDSGGFRQGRQVAFGDVAEVADAGRAGADALGGGAGSPAHRAGEDEFKVVAAELGPGVKKGVEVFAGFDGAEIEDEGLGEAEADAEGFGVRRGGLEEAVIDAGMDGDDLLRGEAEKADSVLAGVFADGDEAVGFGGDLGGEALVGFDVGRGVEFGHEPAGEVVEGGGEGHAGDGMVDLIGGVEDVGFMVGKTHEPAGAVVGAEEEGDAGNGLPGAEGGLFVSEVADLVEEGEGGDLVAGAGLAEGDDPMVEVVFYAGAAEEERGGVDGQVHEVLSC